MELGDSNPRPPGCDANPRSARRVSLAGRPLPGRSRSCSLRSLMAVVFRRCLTPRLTPAPAGSSAASVYHACAHRVRRLLLLRIEESIVPSRGKRVRVERGLDKALEPRHDRRGHRRDDRRGDDGQDDRLRERQQPDGRDRDESDAGDQPRRPPEVPQPPRRREQRSEIALRCTGRHVRKRTERRAGAPAKAVTSQGRDLPALDGAEEASVEWCR
jgi:hypothetical protein